MAPRNETEAAVAEIWSDLFGLKRIGIHDHFLELGGDSLFAAQVASRIWERFGIELTLETLLDHGTVGGTCRLRFQQHPKPSSSGQVG